MATSQLRNVIRQLRSVALFDTAGLTDGQLLNRFITHRDETAFAALVRRHGPMVWGVCRRAAGNHHDAEDAFQATFLVLVRKAATIVPREMVANWLHGVAHNTAIKARAMADKHHARERQVKEMPEPEAGEPDLWRELQPRLDQELSRLPDMYRVPIVLCDLEGRTHKDAARQLGLPQGTLSARLSRARGMLARRLAPRGVLLSGGALAGTLSLHAAPAAVPAAMLDATIQAATLLAAGQAAAGAISVKVAALAEGVLKTMFLTKLKIATSLLVLVGLLGGGAGVGFLALRTQAAEPSQQQKGDVRPSQFIRRSAPRDVKSELPESATLKRLPWMASTASS
jgi:RNA polymerase sigma factor (sigma-70 family)